MALEVDRRTEEQTWRLVLETKTPGTGMAAYPLLQRLRAQPPAILDALGNHYPVPGSVPNLILWRGAK